MTEKIAVIGLGYVGLPVLLGAARHFSGVVGFDISKRRIDALHQYNDWTEEVSADQLKNCTASFTCNAADMAACSFFIVTVPTPIDAAKRPELEPVLSACRTIGEVLRTRGKVSQVPVIVFESTVYPGLTEEVCGAEIARVSGLQQSRDFKLGYSPERINPGDTKHRLENITKIVSAEDEDTLRRVSDVYGRIVTAGLHVTSSIKVAEAAKVLENTQRDLNIALMNELAIMCDRMDMRTHDVLRAAGTKWNFLPFTPGLVGGHCIGVDPYYLTSRAEELGYHPEVILAGRRINDNMPNFIAQKVMKLLAQSEVPVARPRVGILGLTFKENVRDLRNSRIPDIVTELQSFGATVLVHDPMVDPAHARHEYGLALAERTDLHDLDVLIYAVSHAVFVGQGAAVLNGLKLNGILVDIKSALDPQALPATIRYWSL